MGRTLPTFNTYLEQEIAQWAPFRRALRRKDRESFDRLFALVKRHMAEAANAARPVPFDALVMSIVLEHQKAIESLRDELERVKNTEAPNTTATDSFTTDVPPAAPMENSAAISPSTPGEAPGAAPGEAPVLPPAMTPPWTPSPPHRDSKSDSGSDSDFIPTISFPEATAKVSPTPGRRAS